MFRGDGIKGADGEMSVVLICGLRYLSEEGRINPSDMLLVITLKIWYYFVYTSFEVIIGVDHSFVLCSGFNRCFSYDDFLCL